MDGLLSGTLDFTLHKRVGIRKPRLKAMPPPWLTHTLIAGSNVFI